MVENDRAGKYELIFVNSIGPVVTHKHLSLEAGQHLLEFDLFDFQLSSGVYYLTIQSNIKPPETKKLIIQK